MWKLAFRNVFRHGARTALTLAAIAFGVASLILSTGFIHDFLLQLREATIHSQFGHLQIYKEGYYKFGNRAPYDYMIDEPEKKIAEFSRLENVSDIMPRINFSALLSNGRTTFPIVGEGIDPAKEQRLSSYMRFTSGTHLADKHPFTIIIGQGVANALKLKLGDAAILLVNTRDGALNTLDFKVVGIFQTFSKEYDDRAVRIPISAAQELVATKAAHSLVLSLKETAHTDAVGEELRRLLAGGFEVKTWYELADFYQKSIDLYNRYFSVLNLIILGLVLLSVANTVNMTLFERTGEFGTLKALGNRGSRVFGLIQSEMVLLGLFGSGAGVAIGTLVAVVVSAIGIDMPPMPNTNSDYTARISLVPTEVLKAFIIGFLATVGASLAPARRASRIPVVEALRYN
jgi:putative ABC transport system permease protein